MFVLGGVLAHAPVSMQEQRWFFEGYGPAGLVRDVLSPTGIVNLARSSLDVEQ